MSYAVARPEKKFHIANSDLFLAKRYSRTSFSICKLSISASCKTNMDGSDHRTAFTKVRLYRKRDNSSCYELITRAPTRREMKVSSLLGDVKVMSVFLQALIAATNKRKQACWIVAVQY